MHAAAIIKAEKKGDAWLADRIYSGVPAGMFGKEQEIEIGHYSGESNVVYWLKKRGYEPTKELVAAVLGAAKRGNRVLTDDEIVAIVQAFRAVGRARSVRPRRRSASAGPRPEPERPGVLDDALGDRVVRGAGDPAAQPAAGARVERVIGAWRSDAVVELGLLIVVPQDEAAIAVPARRARAQVGILDVDVRVALVVEPDDVAAVVARRRASAAGPGAAAGA